LKYVLDACAMVAYLENEPGGTIVGSLLADRANTCYAHSLNLCEVYYLAIRRSTTATAEAAIEALFNDGVFERKDNSRRFWKRVGEHKARGGISLPDCYCITLAQELSAEVVTSDHGEFDPLVPLGIVPIKFIR
jgi:PIN domain nuclease of toxin-antitoxin system